jgi:hypothetical protein
VQVTSYPGGASEPRPYMLSSVLLLCMLAKPVMSV